MKIYNNYLELDSGLKIPNPFGSRPLVSELCLLTFDMSKKVTTEYFVIRFKSYD
jgi:hypothetical protein